MHQTKIHSFIRSLRVRELRDMMLKSMLKLAKWSLFCSLSFLNLAQPLSHANVTFQKALSSSSLSLSLSLAHLTISVILTILR